MVLKIGPDRPVQPVESGTSTWSSSVKNWEPAGSTTFKNIYIFEKKKKVLC
jgi:hypothetical protein